jgi:CrcB protein
MRLVLIAVGGAHGALARYGLAGAVHLVVPTSFPIGTFIVNILGCLLFGAIMGFAEFRAPLSIDARAFLLVGVLGGFTTFSSFTWETFVLIRTGEWARTALNTVGQTAIGLVALWAGWMIARVWP